MTTGSTGSFFQQAYANDCGGGSIVIDNRTSWTGADRSDPAPQPPTTFLRDIVEYRAVNDGEKPTNIRRRRIRVYGDQTRPPPRDLQDGLHPFSKSWTDISDTPLTWANAKHPIWNPDPVTKSGLALSCGFAPGAIPWRYDEDEDLGEVLDRLATEVKGGDFNMASFLGAEGHDTLKFLADSTVRVARSLKHLRRGNLAAAVDVVIHSDDRWIRKAATSRKGREAEHHAQYTNAVKHYRDTFPGDRTGREWADISADGWLKYHLAAEPLLGDIKAAAEMIGYNLSRPQVKRFRATLTRNANGQTPGFTGPGSPSSPVGWGELYRRKRYQYVLYVTEDPNSLPKLTGLLDPEVVLWNAIPLSFVADWFYPIGDFLERRAFAGSIKGEYVLTVKSETVARGLHARSGPNKGYEFINGSGNRFCQGSIARTVGTSLPVPQPKFKPLGAVDSWQRALTASALIQAIGGGFLSRT